MPSPLTPSFRPVAAGQTASSRPQGMALRIPAPSPESPSPPQPPRCSMQRRPCRACCNTQWLASPCRWARKPTPQASFSPATASGAALSRWGQTGGVRRYMAGGTGGGFWARAGRDGLEASEAAIFSAGSTNPPLSRVGILGIRSPVH